jgi:hypothetical protein
MTVTIGFLGSGDISDTLNDLLLLDLVEAVGGGVEFVVPLDDAHTTPAMAFVLLFARDHNIPLVIATDGRTAAVNARQTLRGGEPVLMVMQRLTAAADPRLFVYWNEPDDGLSSVYQEALNHSIEVLDLCDAGTRLGSLQPPTTQQENNHKVAQDFTYNQLEAMEQGECEALARAFGLDPDSYEDWPPLFDDMLQAQEEAAAAAEADGVEEPPEAGTTGGEDVEANYTDEQLDAMEIPELRAICEANGLTDDLGLRPRKTTYIRVIKEAQGGAGPEPAANEPDSVPEAEEPVGAPVAVPATIEVKAEPVDFGPVVEAINNGFLGLAEVIAEMIGKVLDPMTAIAESQAALVVAAEKAPAKPLGAVSKASKPVG